MVVLTVYVKKVVAKIGQMCYFMTRINVLKITLHMATVSEPTASLFAAGLLVDAFNLEPLYNFHYQIYFICLIHIYSV